MGDVYTWPMADAAKVQVTAYGWQRGWAGQGVDISPHLQAGQAT